MKNLVIGEKIAAVPIIQGGMGVGVSLSSLAGAVAKEGGVGIISTAQIGFEEDDFEKHSEDCNLAAIEKHIRKAKEIAQGNGLVGVNVMVALEGYKAHVKKAVEAGADVVICGAGLPTDLPELVAGSDTKIAPIVSSQKAAKVILKMWDRDYHTTADFIVIEGPKAGGHLGYHMEDLEQIDQINFDEIVTKVIEEKHKYEEKYEKRIPVIVGGGVFDHEDIEHFMELGADGVQIASRFVATTECDASEAYKKAYIAAKEADIQLIKSPVGMPGRAVKNAFMEKVQKESLPIHKCYRCLKTCDPSNTPYCITKALTDAVRGDVENGLVFCGANTDRIHRIVSVHDLMQDLLKTLL